MCVHVRNGIERSSSCNEQQFEREIVLLAKSYLKEIYDKREEKARKMLDDLEYQYSEEELLLL